jgi:hypothetical protein
MLVNEATRLMTSNFYESKNGMVGPACELFHKWRLGGHPLVIVQQDNAGENKLL